MNSDDVAVACAWSNTADVATAHAAAIRFATPPRRCGACIPTDAELTALTAVGVPSSHYEARPRNVGGTALACTPADAPPRCRRNGSFTAVAVWSADVSPRQHRSDRSFTPSAAADADSPCGSPRVRLTGTLSRHSSFAKSTLYNCVRSSISPAATGTAAECYSASSRSTSAWHGVSPSLSGTPSEQEEGRTTPSTGSGCMSASAESLLALRRVPSAYHDARPLSSPSFACFSGTGLGGRHHSASSLREKASNPCSPPAFLPPHCCGGRDEEPVSIVSHGVAEHKFFEPLRLDACVRPFSTPHRHSSLRFSHQRLGGVPALEPRELHCGLRPVDERVLGHPRSSVASTTQIRMHEMVKQQQLLHACLVAIAHERGEVSTAPPPTPRPVSPSRRSGFGGLLRALVRLLCTVLLSLPRRLLARVLACRTGALS
ncbi:hypothetical protein NESM_000135600 [Novymonas esmeraldas]|uniref:Uncharacterized protein n=1 Tax=Novymonas esmeraldas TaxID=1808958 RepID=A0AAW0F6E3_9TRYP